MSCSSPYLTAALSNKLRKIVIENLVKLIKESNVEFDTVCFRGFSGALIGPSVADALGKELLLVRKDTQDCHSHQLTEGNLACKKFIIVDDTVCSGATVRNTLLAAFGKCVNATCSGVFLYHNIAPFRREDYGSGTKIYYGLPTWSIYVNPTKEKLTHYNGKAL